LEHNTKQIIKYNNSSIYGQRANGKRRCIVSFISDDGKQTDYTILKPIFQSKNIACSGCLIPNGSNQMTNEQINELIELGWDFGSHTVNHYRLPTLTNEEIEYELSESKRIIEQTRGFQCDYIVYPNGENDYRVREIAQKYYRFGLATGGTLTTYPVKTYQINRIALGSYYDGISKDTLEYYKKMFNEAYSKKLWIIYMLHSEANQFDEIQQQYLKDLIDYIKTFEDVDILPINKAYKEFGNMISIGDGTKEKMVITNAGDIFEEPRTLNLKSKKKTFLAGENCEDGNLINFYENGNLRINRIEINNSINSLTIRSVGKNIWSGERFAKDIIDTVKDESLAWYCEKNNRRCIALKGSSDLLNKVVFNNFLENTQYTISFDWLRDSLNTGNGGGLKFVYSDGSETNADVSSAISTWSNYAFGSKNGYTINSIQLHYGSRDMITYIDIDTVQLEIGEYKTSFEQYKENELYISSSLLKGDIIKLSNGKLYKGITEVQFFGSLKAYKNGLIYIKEADEVLYIEYPLNLYGSLNN
uniref:polysaccharide deacetylase family protein n=1 Tax=Clostridium sp. D53t1_180928_C8 TaxID=2787101 RepID=UPI0018A8D0A9